MREYDVVLNNAKLPFAFISVLLKIDLIHNYKQIFAICTDTINSIDARSRLIYYGVKVRVGLKCTALYNKKPGDLFFWAFWLCLVSILSCIHRVWSKLFTGFYQAGFSFFLSFFLSFLFFFQLQFYVKSSVICRPVKLVSAEKVWCCTPYCWSIHPVSL